jgi:hypothetical protein
MNWKQLYQQAHERDFKIKYPAAYSDGHYYGPKYPDIKTTNGITTVVQNYIIWQGGYANRINVGGRMIGGIKRTEAGNLFDDRKWITSSTKKGTSDLMCSIEGHMVCIEIKNAATKDTIRPAQIKERTRVEKSGAVYVVVRIIEEFFEWYFIYTKQLKEAT